MVSAEDIIKKLSLIPLPEEGGYFRETFRAEKSSKLERCYSTAIYYLVTPESFSALHRVKSDEVFHFYSGDPVEMVQIDGDGKLSKFKMGSNFMGHERLQVAVPKNCWQGLRLVDGGKWALMGCTVAPGFEFVDFEVGARQTLMMQFPKLESQILLYTR